MIFKFSKKLWSLSGAIQMCSDWIISKFTLCVAGPTLENLGMEMDGWKQKFAIIYKLTLHAVCLGPSLEEKLLVSCDINTSGQEQIKLNTSEVGHKALGPCSSKNHPSLTTKNGGAVDGRVSGTTTTEAEKTSDQNLSIEESGELMKYSAKSWFNQISLKC